MSTMAGSIEGKSRRLRPAMVSLRLQVLDFVHDYIARWRHSPSLGEIAAAVGVRRQYAHQIVGNLTASGLLIKIPGPRGLRLPQQRDEAVQLLRSLGWSVDDRAHEATNRRLMEGPAIDYAPTLAGRRGNSSNGDYERGGIRRISGGWQG
ncbi:LexA family protein [Novosphingobium humi]|uniref:LexA DNA binding domain-containing protein n=1 Tax=Novosphingobium humi TaxID=2282397 RepID=A0ABY7TZE5_9SPHN|nr:hypothetical protein [Novosphingobium humi]WCT78649.1 hypothetical protein PQ457_06715 [Novosphingobium humi]